MSRESSHLWLALVTICLLFSTSTRSAQAQWTLLHRFDSAFVRQIEFANTVPPTFGAIVNHDSVFVTRDGGQTWKSVFGDSRCNSFKHSALFSLAIKDSTYLWVATGLCSRVTSGLYRSSDAGATWEERTPAQGSDFYWAVYFDTSTQRLFTSQYASECIQRSDDLGQTWKSYPYSTLYPTGYAFEIGGWLGLTSPYYGEGRIYRTTDGGDSWEVVNRWLDIGGIAITNIAKTSVFVIPAYGENKILRTTNLGSNWDTVARIPGKLTGGIVEENGNLFIQTVETGVYTSIDSGSNWRFICGPRGRHASRFTAVGKYLYVADDSGGLWLNTSGMGSDTKPRLQTLNIYDQLCATLDTVIPLSFDGCGGMYVEDVIVSSETYTVQASAPYPYHVTDFDTLRVTHSLSNRDWDTATVRMRYGVGIRNFDTTITLITKGTGARPLTSSNQFSFSQRGCGPFDSTLSIAFDGCLLVRFDSAWIEGSSKFSTGAFAPHEFYPFDSLSIHYEPTDRSRDTAILHLRFSSGDWIHDTTILLTGEGQRPLDELRIIASEPSLRAAVDEPVSLQLFSDHRVENRNLNTIEFELRYNSDLLTHRGSTTSVAGATLTTGAVNINGREGTLPITLAGSNMSLDASAALAAIEFTPTLTTETSTPIIIQNLKLNGGDVQYERCTLSASADTAVFQLQLDCGDETIRQHMLAKLPFTILSVTPNPTSGIIEAVVRGGSGVSYDVLDLMGKTMTSGEMDGEHLTLDLSSYGSGSYYLRFAGMGRVETRRVVVGR
jgi:photosystem II stability/assembly factor-like uncharacterized protein